MENYSIIDDVIDWNKYLIDNTDFKLNGFNTIEKAKIHYYRYGKKEGRKIHFLNIKKYNNIDWKRYLKENNDIVKAGFNTKEKAIEHYELYGKKEDRLIHYLKKYNENLLEDNKNLKKNNKTLIVLDNYNKGNIENQTDLFQKELLADVMVINTSIKNHKKIINNNYLEYNTILWQNTFSKIKNKNKNQKYYYAVHNNGDTFSDSQINIIKENNHLIDEYIYNDKYIKKNFEKNVLIPNNSQIIENILPPNFNLYTIVIGGLGNQLFMLFNIISLAKKYNMNFNICFDKDYKLRPSCEKYSLFKKIKFKELTNEELKDYEIYTEPEFRFNKILLNNKNYHIKGYFQSYKYFWDYKDEIKKYIYIDYDKINNIKNKFNSYGKKILAIHIRLTDYIEFKDIHYNLPIEYYKNALKNYNLEDYQIILFSDDIDLADKKLKNLNLKYINADEILEDDEDQFYMLALSDVKICANSTFCLMPCFLNDIFEFVPDCEYVFPDKWLGKNGQNYNMYDIFDFNNKKYKIITSKKCAVIFFHKNIQKLYKKRWIDKCIETILNQEKINFDIFEINYGNDDYSIFENIKLDKKFNY